MAKTNQRINKAWKPKDRVQKRYENKKYRHSIKELNKNIVNSTLEDIYLNDEYMDELDVYDDAHQANTRNVHFSEEQ